MKFFEEFKLHINFVINPAYQKVLGLVEMNFGLVHASYSLPEWQAVKLTFLICFLVKGNHYISQQSALSVLFVVHPFCVAGYPVVHHCYQHYLGGLCLLSFTLHLKQILLFSFMVAKLPLQKNFNHEAT